MVSVAVVTNPVRLVLFNVNRFSSDCAIMGSAKKHNFALGDFTQEESQIRSAILHLAILNRVRNADGLSRGNAECVSFHLA